MLRWTSPRTRGVPRQRRGRSTSGEGGAGRRRGARPPDVRTCVASRLPTISGVLARLELVGVISRVGGSGGLHRLGSTLLHACRSDRVRASIQPSVPTSGSPGPRAPSRSASPIDATRRAATEQRRAGAACTLGGSRREARSPRGWVRQSLASPRSRRSARLSRQARQAAPVAIGSHASSRHHLALDALNQHMSAQLCERQRRHIGRRLTRTEPATALAHPSVERRLTSRRAS